MRCVVNFLIPLNARLKLGAARLPFPASRRFAIEVVNKSRALYFLHSTPRRQI